MAERVGPVISAWRGVLRPNLLPMPVSDDCQCLFALVHVRARGVLCNFRAQSQSFDGAMSLSFSFSSSSFPSATLRTICLFSPLAASHCQQQQQQWPLNEKKRENTNWRHKLDSNLKSGVVEAVVVVVMVAILNGILLFSSTWQQQERSCRMQCRKQKMATVSL